MLILSNYDELENVGYVDSELVSSHADMKSTSCYVFKLTDEEIS